MQADAAVGLATACLHLVSRGLVLLQILRHGSVRGLSLIAQELYLIVYLTRYAGDLLTMYTGLLDMLGKLSRLSLALSLVALIRFSAVSKTYEAGLDVTPRWVLMTPPAVASCVFTTYLMVIQILHQFSWYLEPLALIPQFVVLAKRAPQGGYPAWVLAFTALAGLEGVASNWQLLRDMPHALAHDPYSLYAAWVQCAVLLFGSAALVASRFQAQQAAGLNESTQKPGFNEEWQADQFTFTGEGGSAAAATHGSGMAAGGHVIPAASPIRKSPV